MSSADVEFPVVQSLVDVGGTYASPAHNITFSGITFTGTSWLGPSSNQGYADQQTGAYLVGHLGPAERRADLLPVRLPAVRGDPAVVVADARRRAGIGGQHHHVQRRPVRQPRSDRAGYRQRRQRARQRRRSGRQLDHRHPVHVRLSTRPARSWPVAYGPTRTTRATRG